MVIYQPLWLSTEEILTPGGHWVMSGDVCGVRTWQGGRTPGRGWMGPEMLPHIPTVPRVAPQQPPQRTTWL